jgi:hypothetical protein
MIFRETDFLVSRFFYGDRIMKRILLFFVLFFILCVPLSAQPVPEITGIRVDPLVNFDNVFDMLKDIAVELLSQYYGLLLVIFVTFLIFNYIQGILEGKKVEAKREKQLRESAGCQRERAQEKQLMRERALIRKYSFGNDETVARIQLEMSSEKIQKDSGELRLAPIDDDAVDNSADRGGMYWHFDGTEEGCPENEEETVGFGNSTTVDLRPKYRNHFRYRVDDDRNDGY